MRKKQSISRLLAVLLAASMAATVASCGQEEASQPAEAESSSAETSADAGSEAAAEEGPWYKYPETVTLTRAQETINATQWPEGDNEESNVWTRAAKDQFNIDLQNYWATDTSQYHEKINISIASQDLPDVFTVDSNQFAQVVEAGMVQPLDEAYEKNASDLLKQIMEADPVGFDSGRVDGQLMALSKQHFGTISTLNCVWIRDDWLQNLGLSAPTTMDELVNICEKFTTEDPDGNGVDDTYGLAVDKSINSLLQLAPAYHANPGMWIRNAEGQIEYGSIQPEMKTALAAFQDWYSRGIISTEFGIKDGAKISEDIVSGKVGVHITGSSFGYSPGTDVVKRNGAEAVFYPYAIPSSDDEPAMLNAPWPVSRYMVVSKDCEHPEAAIRMVNLYVHEMNESLGEEYDSFAKNEVKWGATPFDVNNPDADYAQAVAIIDAIETGDDSKLLPDQLGKYQYVVKCRDEKDPDSVGYWTQVGPGGAYEVLKPFVDNKQYVLTEFRGVSTPTMVDKQSSLDTLETEAFTKIVMGEESLDSFDTFVENWKALGGDDITKEMNEAYPAE